MAQEKIKLYNNGDNKITDASFINNWNISSTANFTRMFRGVPTP